VQSRQGSQAIVEFGIIALLFTALMFAVVDFGLLLNTWLSVSSGTREIARSASVGKQQPFLQDEAVHLTVPAVSAAGFSKYCCDASSAIEVKVDYLTCAPSQSCSPDQRRTVEAMYIPREYPFRSVDQTGTSQYTAGQCADVPTCHPQPDDLVRITVIAHGAQVITPLLRPFFGCTDGSQPRCNVELHSTATMRFEGQEF
jgi:hypothetical protein